MMEQSRLLSDFLIRSGILFGEGSTCNGCLLLNGMLNGMFTLYIKKENISETIQMELARAW